MARASRRVKPRLEGLRSRSPAKPDWEMAHSRGWGTGRNHGMLCVGGLALVVLWCTLARAMARLRSGRGARWPALAPGSVSVELLGGGSVEWLHHQAQDQSAPARDTARALQDATAGAAQG